MGFPILTTIFLLPLAAALIISFLPRGAHDTVRHVAAGGTALALILTIVCYVNYDITAGGIQFMERVPWITDLGVSYAVGVDGISLPMLLITNAIALSAVCNSWHIEKRTKEFYILLLLFVAGLIGTFLACDLFIFLLCYEVVVIPVYILILIWGSTRRITKEYGAMKLTMFLLMGSGMMLVGIVSMYLMAYPAGQRTFDFGGLMLATQMGHFSEGFQIFAFFLLLLSFGSLITLFPLHNWSPDGHASAPTAVSMLHAGVLKKLGGYGLIRIGLLILPLGARFWAPLIIALAAITVIYAGYIALAQKDLKYIIGYSSVSHLGYIALGFAALNVVSLSGAVANMVAHGIMAALFFAQIGYIYEKTHLRSVPELAGLAHYMPHLTFGFMLAGLASVGLPGLSGFVPEVTIFIGTMKVYPVCAVIAIAGIIITALYILRMLAKLLFGPAVPRFASVPDEHGVDLVPLIVLGTLIVVFGIFPDLLMGVIRSTILPLEPMLDDISTAPTILDGFSYAIGGGF